MSPALAAAIDAATDLAWRPTANLPGSLRYQERRESADRFCERMAALPRLSAKASPELRFLVLAMRRVRWCSFANRRGAPYYERRQAIWELRGCLEVWRGSIGGLRPTHTPPDIT